MLNGFNVGSAKIRSIGSRFLDQALSSRRALTPYINVHGIIPSRFAKRTDGHRGAFTVNLSCRAIDV